MSEFTNFSTTIIHQNNFTNHHNNSNIFNNDTHHFHQVNTTLIPTQQHPPVIPLWFHKFIFGIYILLLVIGGIGNALICFVLIKRKRKRSIHLLTLNLAISDLIVCIMYVPTQMYLIQVSYRWGLGELTCQAMFSINSCTVNASIGTLIAITYDRYVAVTKPMVAHKGTTKRTKILILVVWVVSALITIPLSNVTELHNGYCAEHWKSKDFMNAYWISVFVAQLPIPMLYICGVYAIIIYSVRTSHSQFELVKIHNNMQQQQLERQQQQQQQQQEQQQHQQQKQQQEQQQQHHQQQHQQQQQQGDPQQHRQKTQEQLHYNTKNSIKNSKVVKSDDNENKMTTNDNNNISNSNTSLTQYVMNITRSISYKRKHAKTNMRNGGCPPQHNTPIMGREEYTALMTNTTEHHHNKTPKSKTSKSNNRRLSIGRKRRQKHKQRRKKQQNKLLKMSVCLVIAYAVCVTPQHAVFFAVTFGNLGTKPYAAFFFIISNVLMSMNSAINPCIYGTLNDEMKKSIASLFKCTSSSASRRAGQRSGTFSEAFNSLRETIRRRFKLTGTAAGTFNRDKSGLIRNSTVISEF